MSLWADGFWAQGFWASGFWAEGISYTPDIRLQFNALRGQGNFDGYTFAPVTKDPAETLKVRLNLFVQCANFWNRNEQVEEAEHVRPSRANGFAYEADNAGCTANREPIWPTATNSTVVDGSVTWRRRSAGSNGINAIANPAGVSDPSGVTIAAVSVEEYTNILATYSGGGLDQDYDATFTFTLNGVTRVARQRVSIRKK